MQLILRTQQTVDGEVAVDPTDVVAVEVGAEPVPERNVAPPQRRRRRVDRDDRELAVRLVDHIVARGNARNSQ